MRDTSHLRCSVDGCRNKRLASTRRDLTCAEHARASEVMIRGVLSRACTNCCTFHPLTEFKGENRNCFKVIRKQMYRRADAQTNMTRAKEILHAEVLRQIHQDTILLIGPDKFFDVRHLKMVYESFDNPYVQMTIAGDYSPVPGDALQNSVQTLVDFFWFVVLKSVYPTIDARECSIFARDCDGGEKHVDTSWFEMQKLSASTLLDRVRCSWQNFFYNDDQTLRWGYKRKRTTREQLVAEKTKIKQQAKRPRGLARSIGCCFECYATVTPQWRFRNNMQLCNACGARHLKKEKPNKSISYHEQTF